MIHKLHYKTSVKLYYKIYPPCVTNNTLTIGYFNYAANYYIFYNNYYALLFTSSQLSPWSGLNTLMSTPYS